MITRPLRALIPALLATSCLAMAAQRSKPLEWPTVPPVAKQLPVTETFFGTTLTDPYRYMETPDDPETKGWLHAQGAHTRNILDAIPRRATYLNRLSEIGGSFGVISSYREAGGRAFYLERGPGADVSDLVVREPDGRSRKLVDIARLVDDSGKPHAIDYYVVSRDGGRVAVGISVGGGENSDLRVFDVATGNQTVTPRADARYAASSFSEDGRLAFNRFQSLAPGQASSDTFLNQTTFVWDLNSEPVAVAGATARTGPPMRPTESATLTFPRGSSDAILSIQDGVQSEVRLYITKAAKVTSPDPQWRMLVDVDAGVTDFAVQKQNLYLMSHKDAPSFRVLRLALDDTNARPEIVIEPNSTRVLSTIWAAEDALYVVAREGIYEKLLRLPNGTTSVEEISLPIKGHVSRIFTDPTRAGAVVGVEGWTRPVTYYRVDPTTREFQPMPSGVRPALDLGRFGEHDLLAKAKDDTRIPLTVISPSGPRSPRPMVLWAYGSYGESWLPSFSASRLVSLEAGAAYSVCHVRGGGELGEAWRLAGKDANKPNTWRDLIACAEHLIAEGWTSPGQLMIAGGSAGGIAVGRAMIERPELFAAVLSQVPMASAIRAEFQKNGPVNIVEFGTIKDQTGFYNLLAMDAYYSIEPGKSYPAVMFTAGLNDARVDAWQPAKATARMQAAGSKNPVLLRVDTDGGHGPGATRRQDEAEEADVAAFLFWRAGLPDWQPNLGQ